MLLAMVPVCSCGLCCLYRSTQPAPCIFWIDSIAWTTVAVPPRVVEDQCIRYEGATENEFILPFT